MIERMVPNMFGMAFRAATALLLVSLPLFSGCASRLFESKQPQSRTYVLRPASSQPVAAAGVGQTLPVALAVARPQPRPGLDSSRIAVLFPDRRMDYFSASRWGAAADVMVQSLLVESLRNAGPLRSVQNDVSGFTADYVLQTELRDFQAEYETDASGIPSIRVTLVCTLGRFRGREPLASYSAVAQVPAQSNNLRAVVSAFEQAYRQSAQTIVDETLKIIRTEQQIPSNN